MAKKKEPTTAVDSENLIESTGMANTPLNSILDDGSAIDSSQKSSFDDVQDGYPYKSGVTRNDLQIQHPVINNLKFIQRTSASVIQHTMQAALVKTKDGEIQIDEAYQQFLFETLQHEECGLASLHDVIRDPNFEFECMAHALDLALEVSNNYLGVKTIKDGAYIIDRQNLNVQEFLRSNKRFDKSGSPIADYRASDEIALASYASRGTILPHDFPNLQSATFLSQHVSANAKISMDLIRANYFEMLFGNAMFAKNKASSSVSLIIDRCETLVKKHIELFVEYSLNNTTGVSLLRINRGKKPSSSLVRSVTDVVYVLFLQLLIKFFNVTKTARFDRLINLQIGEYNYKPVHTPSLQRIFAASDSIALGYQIGTFHTKLAHDLSNDLMSNTSDIYNNDTRRNNNTNAHQSDLICVSNIYSYLLNGFQTLVAHSDQFIVGTMQISSTIRKALPFVLTQDYFLNARDQIEQAIERSPKTIELNTMVAALNDPLFKKLQEHLMTVFDWRQETIADMKGYTHVQNAQHAFDLCALIGSRRDAVEAYVDILINVSKGVDSTQLNEQMKRFLSFKVTTDSVSDNFIASGMDLPGDLFKASGRSYVNAGVLNMVKNSTRSVGILSFESTLAHNEHHYAVPTFKNTSMLENDINRLFDYLTNLESSRVSFDTDVDVLHYDTNPSVQLVALPSVLQNGMPGLEACYPLLTDESLFHNLLSAHDVVIRDGIRVDKLRETFIDFDVLQGKNGIPELLALFFLKITHFFKNTSTGFLYDVTFKAQQKGDLVILDGRDNSSKTDKRNMLWLKDVKLALSYAPVLKMKRFKDGFKSLQPNTSLCNGLGLLSYDMLDTIDGKFLSPLYWTSLVSEWAQNAVLHGNPRLANVVSSPIGLVYKPNAVSPMDRLPTVAEVTPLPLKSFEILCDQKVFSSFIVGLRDKLKRRVQPFIQKGAFSGGKTFLHSVIDDLTDETFIRDIFSALIEVRGLPVCEYIGLVQNYELKAALQSARLEILGNDTIDLVSKISNLLAEWGPRKDDVFLTPAATVRAARPATTPQNVDWNRDVLKALRHKPSFNDYVGERMTNFLYKSDNFMKHDFLNLISFLEVSNLLHNTKVGSEIYNRVSYLTDFHGTRFGDWGVLQKASTKEQSPIARLVCWELLFQVLGLDVIVAIFDVFKVDLLSDVFKNVVLRRYLEVGDLENSTLTNTINTTNIVDKILDDVVLDLSQGLNASSLIYMERQSDGSYNLNQSYRNIADSRVNNAD